MSTIVSTECVFTSGAMFVINSREDTRPSHYTLNPRFDNLSGCILFRLLDKSLDALKYFDLYQFALRMGTDPVMMAVGFHRCGEVV